MMSYLFPYNILFRFGLQLTISKFSWELTALYKEKMVLYKQTSMVTNMTMPTQPWSTHPHPPLPTQPTMVAANRLILCKISPSYLGPGAQGVCLYVNCNTKSLLDPDKNVQGQIRFKLRIPQELHRCMISQSWFFITINFCTSERFGKNLQ
jgi:hypothetical protein